MGIGLFLLVGLLLGLLAGVVTGARRPAAFGSGVILGVVGAMVGGIAGLAGLRVSPRQFWPGGGVLATTIIGAVVVLAGWLLLGRLLARKVARGGDRAARAVPTSRKHGSQPAGKDED